MEQFKGGKEASKILGVHIMTLRRWDERGLIETIRMPGGKRLYNVKKFLDMKNKILVNEENDERKNFVYVRVSSAAQKEDLIHQKEYMKTLYPNHIIIEDIGSGINFNRKGIKRLIKLAISGKVNEVVIAYKDRLTRFGYELIESLITDYSHGKIIILNKKEIKEPTEELLMDTLQLMTVFIAKLHGLRKYKNKT